MKSGPLGSIVLLIVIGGVVYLAATGRLVPVWDTITGKKP